MDYLSRGSAPFSEALWAQIDEAVVGTARRLLVGRRFLSLYGPLGPGALSVQLDDLTARAIEDDGEMVLTTGRSFVELPLLYQDFALGWRELEHSESGSLPVDLSPALSAAAASARAENCFRPR